MAQSPTRRGLFAALGPLPLAALLPAATASAQPRLPQLRSFDFTPYRRDAGRGMDCPADWAHVDAELIAQCDRMVEARAELLRLYCGKNSPDDPDNHPVIGPRIAALDAVEDELMPLLAGMRASSLACAEAMARVALIFAEREANWQVPEHGREWPGMAAVEWLAGDDFYRWAATHPSERTDAPPPPVRRAVA
jgi:hypothetical protein